MQQHCVLSARFFEEMAHHHQHQNEQKLPSFMLDALYCEEENWEDVDAEDCFIDEHSYCTTTTTTNNNNTNNNSDNVVNMTKSPLLEQDLFWEEEELCSLLSKERVVNDLCENGNPSLTDARSESVEWILKVSGYYSFSAATALLALNYLDRFIFSCCFQSHREKKPWMTQLASVACLSLAAKVEETQVPLLLDLQVEDSKFVFEAKTIQRMEILILSTLQWKMNPVTPLSFIDYVTRRLGLKNHSCWEFLRRCERLLLSVISDCRFMCYLPSVIATATMLHIFNSVEPCLGVEYREQLLGILGINEEKVEECYRLMLVVASTSAVYFQSSNNNKRKFGTSTLPGSPRGVMDMSFSYDTSSSNDSWSVATATATASVSSSPEPLLKRSRAPSTRLAED